MRNIFKGVTTIAIIFLLTITLSTFTKKASAADNREVEDNNLKSTATSIRLQETYTGQLSTVNDVDYYTFEITENGYFNIDFGIASLDTESLTDGWNIAIYNSDVLVYSCENVKNKIRTTNFAFPKGSKIYIKVTPYLTYPDYCPISIDYNVSANFTVSEFWEQEYNDTKSTANKICMNSDYYGNIQR